LQLFHDTEAQRQYTIVKVLQRSPHPVYTQALARPDILAPASDFLFAKDRVLTSCEFETTDLVRDCLLITCELDKAILCRVLVAAALLSLAPWVLVDILSHQAQLGIAISNLLATVLSCVEVVLVWLI
jgi:hypothetical protein